MPNSAASEQASITAREHVIPRDNGKPRETHMDGRLHEIATHSTPLARKRALCNPELCVDQGRNHLWLPSSWLSLHGWPLYKILPPATSRRCILPCSVWAALVLPTGRVAQRSPRDGEQTGLSKKGGVTPCISGRPRPRSARVSQLPFNLHS